MTRRPTEKDVLSTFEKFGSVQSGGPGGPLPRVPLSVACQCRALPPVSCTLDLPARQSRAQAAPLLFPPLSFRSPSCPALPAPPAVRVLLQRRCVFVDYASSAAASKAMGALNNRAIPQLSGGWVGNGRKGGLEDERGRNVGRVKEGRVAAWQRGGG